MPVYLIRAETGVDARGNLLYRAQCAREHIAGDVIEVIPQFSESDALVRANFDTRTVDTIAAVRIAPFNGITYSKDASGKYTTDALRRRVPTLTIKPLYTIDDWSVLSDGSVAIVRGHDYHVDIIQTDGRRARERIRDCQRATGHSELRVSTRF